jgi:hypothetical protein
VTISQSELQRARSFLADQRKLFCIRDGCKGLFDVVAGPDDRIHLTCPVCAFSSAEHKSTAEGFTVGARVRCVGYPIIGAGTVVDVFPRIGKLQVSFDRGIPPRNDFMEFIADDGSIGVSSTFMELLYP